MYDITDRCQSVLRLLADLLASVRLEPATLAPLLRAALLSLTCDRLKLLQTKAMGERAPPP